MPEVKVQSSEAAIAVDEDIQKAVAKKHRKIANAYKQVFNSPAGKIVLNDLMRSCRFLDCEYTGDSYETHVQLGYRQVVTRILRTMALPLDSIQKLMTEANSEVFEQQ